MKKSRYIIDVQRTTWWSMASIGNNFKNYKYLIIPCQYGEPYGISDMLKFCIDAIIFLSKNEKNTIAVHSRDGINRCGMLIWAFLGFLGIDHLLKDDNDATMVFEHIVKHEFNWSKEEQYEQKFMRCKNLLISFNFPHCYLTINNLGVKMANKICENVTGFYAKRRTRDESGIQNKSQLRYLRLFMLYLFNDFKMQVSDSSERCSFFHEIFNHMRIHDIEELYKPEK